MQYFKGDELELKFFNIGKPIVENLGLQHDLFFQQAYDSFILGQLIWDSQRSPLANAIPREIFREAFTEIFNTFLIAGTFESYLSIFKNIFGADVVVEFTVPGPGKLNIDINAQGVQTAHLVADSIVGNAYVFDKIVDDDGNNIVVQYLKGLESEYEVEQMLFELVPAGIFTTINLTIGSP